MIWKGSDLGRRQWTLPAKSWETAKVGLDEYHDVPALDRARDLLRVSYQPTSAPGYYTDSRI